MDSNDEHAIPYGKWVRKQREMLGLSQLELARRAHISLAQIYNIEAGRSKNPRRETRRRIEHVFGAVDREARDDRSGIDLPQGQQETSQEDGQPLTCSFCKRTLEQVRAIAWISDEQDPTACNYCVDKLNSIFAHGARRDRYDGKTKLRLVPKTTAAGQS
jgi:transcriptional regulator with XRE-family HTH domain